MKVYVVLASVLALSACNREAAPPAKVGAKPAGQAVVGQAVAVVNGDFEQPSTDGAIPGWSQLQHAGEKSYDMRVDSDGAYAGHGSFHILRTHEQVYGTLSQDIDGARYAGKTVELSAMMKSRDVGAKGWKLMVNGNVPGAFKYSPGLTGTADWQRQAVTVKLPPQVRTLTVGATLLDAGEGWLDNVELKVTD